MNGVRWGNSSHGRHWSAGVFLLVIHKKDIPGDWLRVYLKKMYRIQYNYSLDSGSLFSDFLRFFLIGSVSFLGNGSGFPFLSSVLYVSLINFQM